LNSCISDEDITVKTKEEKLQSKCLDVGICLCTRIL